MNQFEKRRENLRVNNGFENYFSSPTWTQEHFLKGKKNNKTLARRVTYPSRDLPPLPQCSRKELNSFAIDRSENMITNITEKVDRNLVDQYVSDIKNFVDFGNGGLKAFKDSNCPYKMSNAGPDKAEKKKKKKNFKVLGRHNAPGTDMRHLPCHLIAAYEDKGGRIDVDIDPNVRKRDEKSNRIDLKTLTSSGFKESFPIPDKMEFSTKPLPKWDEFVIEKLSEDTAERLLIESTSSHTQKRLQKCINAKRVPEEGILITSNDKVETSKAILHNDKSHGLPCNIEITSPLNLSTTEAMKSDEEFLRKIQQGAQPIMEARFGDTIVLDSDPKVTYRVNHQDVFPCEPSKWSQSGAKEIPTMPVKLEKGSRKWKAYPSIIKDHMNNIMEYDNDSSQEFQVSFSSTELFSPRRNDISLIEVVNDWRKQWSVEKKWEDNSPNELIKAMKNINNQIKFGAVSSCCQALVKAEMKAIKQRGHGLASIHERDIHITAIDDNLVENISDLLSDDCKQVAMAASLTLAALNIYNKKAEDILLHEVQHGTTLDCWAATQCLAVMECTSDIVVKELINNAVASDVKKSTTASILLSKLSTKAESVQYMAAEQLNDLSWKERAMACHIVPLLKSKLSKDICHKLSHLMWNDWSSDVREAAAIALGKTGQGKLVHDQLIHRLLDDKESIKLDALRRISNLGIMTTKLLSAFLKCFNDDHLAVRLQTLQTCSSLKLSDERILQRLLHCAKQDESAKVKSEAWIAISNGDSSPEVVEASTWALCYEREAEVRISACVAIAKLEINDNDTIQVLQERIQVEPNDAVRMAVLDTLRRFNVEPTGDLSMRQSVEKEVKYLCRKANVANTIFKDEHDEMRQKMIGNAHLMEDYGELVLKEAHLKDEADSRPSTRGFDPILEGFRIREKSLGLPESSLFNMSKPYLPFEVNTDSSGDENED